MMYVEWQWPHHLCGSCRRHLVGQVCCSSLIIINETPSAAKCLCETSQTIFIVCEEPTHGPTFEFQHFFRFFAYAKLLTQHGDVILCSIHWWHCSPSQIVSLSLCLVLRLCVLHRQLRVSDLHGDSDSVWHEVLGDIERGTSRPGGKELSGRTQVHHQNIRLRRLSLNLQRWLLPSRRKSVAADTLDGLGVCSAGEFGTCVCHNNGKMCL